jgi:SOS-response transcriptional repressor LexA
MVSDRQPSEPAMTTPNRDHEHLARLRDYYADAKRIPSQRRIAELLGFSKAAAHKLLDRLELQRFLDRTPDDDAWVPGSRFFERSLSDTSVAAGMPADARDVSGEPFFVDGYLIRRPSQTILVPVRGESMVDAGIHDGDIVTVDRSLAAKPGDFVIAIVDNEFSLKELASERGAFVLRPHNKAFPVIRPRGSLEIYGVVVGLIRRYSR